MAVVASRFLDQVDRDAGAIKRVGRGSRVMASESKRANTCLPAETARTVPAQPTGKPHDRQDLGLGIRVVVRLGRRGVPTFGDLNRQRCRQLGRGASLR